jgi:hypothetical protein
MNFSLKKKWLYLALILLFISVNTIAWGADLSDTNRIVISLSESKAAAVAQSNKGFASFKGAVLSGKSGEPGLPVRVMKVLLPPDADPATVQASIEAPVYQELSGKWNINPMPPIATNDGQGPVWPAGRVITKGRDQQIYSMNSYFPEKSLGTVTTGQLREVNLAEVQVFPYQYNPKTKKLRHLESGNLVITFDRLVITDSPLVQPENDPLLDEIFSQIQGKAVNFQEIAPSYRGGPGSSGMVAPQVSPHYAILTTSAIRSASANLNRFIAVKQRQGFIVEVITSTMWGGGSGDTAANNIRAWLATNYLSHHLQYVLLIGSPDPEYSPLPMKRCYPCGPYSDVYPTDFYYAELTGNWDLNGNGYYGEYYGDYGPGGAERYCEVTVGRIPYYGSIADLDSILAKIINYESIPFGIQNWRKHTLLPMVPSDESTPGYQLGEEIKDSVLVPNGLNYTRIYAENYGLTPAPEITPCNYDNVTNSWRSTPAGSVFWWTHGWPEGAVDIMDLPHAATLDNSHPGFTFQCSCTNSAPEDSVNLSYSLLKNGAINTIGGTQVTWYWIGQTSFAGTPSNSGMTFEYSRRLAGDKLTAGRALQGVTTDIDPLIQEFWGNYLSFNVYGDPACGLVQPTEPTLGPAALSYQCQKSESSSNLIHPNLRVVNTGASPINLTNVKIRYWYTNEPNKSQVYKVNYASCGNGNVTGRFVRMATPKSNANYYLEIGFTSGAGNLAPQGNVEVNSEFHTTDWSYYNQTNDYSFDSAFTYLTEYTRITV